MSWLALGWKSVVCFSISKLVFEQSEDGDQLVKHHNIMILYRTLGKHYALSLVFLSLLVSSIPQEEKSPVQQLKQGQIMKDYVVKDSYSYYIFSLAQIDNITSVSTGKTALLVSTLTKMPNLNSSAFDMVQSSSANSSILLPRSKLTSQIYISVFAYEFSEISIGVIVHHSNSSSLNIPLTHGTVQTYTLPQSEPKICFTIDSIDSEYISVFLNELAGNVEMSILDANNQNVNCNDSRQNRFICTFKSTRNHSYTVKVTGKVGQKSVFTISYKTTRQECFTGRFNQPIYATLPSLATYCFQFNIKREMDMVFQAALTHIQQLERHIQTTLLINQKKISTGNTIHKIITTQDIIANCGSSNNTNPCKITVSFLNTVSAIASFSFILEQDDAEIALFDGINQHVHNEGPWSSSGRYFYYPVSSNKLIQIFFTTRSIRSHYFLAAQFVAKDEFLNREQTDDVYLSYMKQVDRVQRNRSENFYSIVLGSLPFARMGISSEEIDDNCPDLDCFLLISIFPEYFKDSINAEYDEYDIEVSQQETSLSLGESKLGILNKDQYFTYLIEPEDAVIEFQAIDRQGKSVFCLSAAAALSNGTVTKTNQFRSDLQLSKTQQVQRIYLRGQKDECAYQIKYLSNTDPFHIVQLSHPYQLTISNPEISRFIHYHQSPTSFRVAHLSTSGDVEVRVLPITHNNFTLTSLAKVPLDSFPIFTDEQGELIINPSHHSFCSNCYYLIAVTTPHQFIGQILFLRTHDPIPLTSNHILKVRLTNQFPAQTYIYHSLTTFELTFNIVAGQIEVDIIDPRGKTVIRESIKEKRMFRVEALDYEGRYQLYSDQSRFTVRVKMMSSAIFYVQIDRIHLTQRIFEGYPSRIQIGSSMAPSIQFISSQQSSHTLSLNINLEQTEASLNFTVTAQVKTGLIGSDQIIQNITHSSHGYTLTLNNYPARYFIAIKTNATIKVTVLLAKSALTFISPAQLYLFNTEGVYHVSTNAERVVVEVYSCVGEFTVFGSPELQELDNQVNATAYPDFVGRGHKVFSIFANSSYFLKIASISKDGNIEYLIRYDYSLANPYDSISSDASEISYESTSEGLIINIKPISIEKPWQIVNIDYAIFASNSKLDLHRYSRCSIPGKVIQTQSRNTTILLSNKLLDGLRSQTIYLTSKTTITLANEAKVLTILSNTLEILPLTQEIQRVAAYKYWLTDNIFIFLMGLLVFCGLSVLAPYWLIVLYLRRWSKMQQNMVEERPDRIGTEQQIAGQSDLPETANKMIKEHI